MTNETPPLVAGRLKTQFMPLGGTGLGMSVTCWLLRAVVAAELRVQIGPSGVQPRTGWLGSARYGPSWGSSMIRELSARRVSPSTVLASSSSKGPPGGARAGTRICLVQEGQPTV